MCVTDYGIKKFIASYVASEVATNYAKTESLIDETARLHFVDSTCFVSAFVNSLTLA